MCSGANLISDRGLAGKRTLCRRGTDGGSIVIWSAVIPAKAGIHSANLRKSAVHGLDSRFRGNDRRFVRDDIPNDTITSACR